MANQTLKHVIQVAKSVNIYCCKGAVFFFFLGGRGRVGGGVFMDLQSVLASQKNIVMI